MLHINGAIVVEGKYDKIKLSNIVDCPIVTTDGFGIFKSAEKKKLIRKYAESGGITVLTDSDSAGFKIRGYIKGFVGKGTVRCAYIPDIFGKERRKRAPSAEGKLGVEGVDEKVIVEALIKAGAAEGGEPKIKEVSRTDLYEDGLFGKEDSSQKRAKLLKRLGLPERLSTSGLLDFINSSMSAEEYKKALEDIEKE